MKALTTDMVTSALSLLKEATNDYRNKVTNYNAVPVFFICKEEPTP